MRHVATKDMARLRQDAAARITAAAAAERAKYATPGKDGLYIAKLDEAARWDDAGQPADLTAFPFMAEETGTTAETAQQLAILWQNLNALWLGVFGPQIEGREQRAKAAIEAAGSPAELDAIKL